MSGAADPTATPTPIWHAPEIIGRYQVLGKLGTGGAASVYLGRVVGIGGFERAVALKMLHPHLRGDSAFVDDFLREARLAARMRHPNVISVEDVGETPEAVYLVMEHVDGVSLSRLQQLADGTQPHLDDGVALRILLDLLAGLHAAHELTDDDGKPLGIVHRDVSPHNVLVDRAGVARLADFGIAKPAVGGGHTASGTIKGKIPYMAPEQVRGRALDRRADLWAAGITAWELFAGRNPHEGKQDVDVLMSIASDPPPSLRERRPDLPNAVHLVIERALAHDPSDRWQTATAFADALVAAFAPRAPAEPRAVAEIVERLAGPELAARRRMLRARDGAEPSSVGPSRPRHARRIAVATLLLAAAAAGGAVWWTRTQSSAPAAPQPQVTQQPAPAAPVVAPPASVPPARVQPQRPPRATEPKRRTAPKRTNRADPPMADNPYQ